MKNSHLLVMIHIIFCCGVDKVICNHNPVLMVFLLELNLDILNVGAKMTC